jgi:hypothetical protein
MIYRCKCGGCGSVSGQGHEKPPACAQCPRCGTNHEGKDPEPHDFLGGRCNRCGTIQEKQAEAKSAHVR